MKYISINDLTNTIRRNLWKVPHDVDFIIGVPRSGMIAASIIASYLNIPLIDVNGFVNGLEPWGGVRLQYFKNNHKQSNKVLVVDDTLYAGTAMKRTKEKLKSTDRYNNYKFIYSAIYYEGWAINEVDFCFEDVRKYVDPKINIVMYEWNLFQHYSHFMDKILFDCDGVFCVNPPDEINKEEYISYIKNAIPLFTPKNKIGGIITYRLNIYRDITEKWLKDNGINYNELVMFNANSYEERKSRTPNPGEYKAKYYKMHDNYKLFIESDNWQAQTIANISNKPVYCVETNYMYNIT